MYTCIQVSLAIYMRLSGLRLSGLLYSFCFLKTSVLCTCVSMYMLHPDVHTLLYLYIYTSNSTILVNTGCEVDMTAIGLSL